MIRPILPVLLLLICAAPRFASAQDNALTPAEKADGWKLLFDGKAVPGMRGLQKPDFLKAGWVIQEGALVLPKTVRQSGDVTGGDLVTIEQFGDFEFSFDFKFTASAHTGILYFARAGTGGKPSGHQYQIIDDVHHPDGLKGGPVRRTGALYDVLPPSVDKKLNVSDTWNTGAIVVRGTHVEHWLNGKMVLEYECDSAALRTAVRENKAKVHTGFGAKIKSSLALLDKGEEVAFRNLKIRAVTADTPKTTFSGPPAEMEPETPAPTPMREIAAVTTPPRPTLMPAATPVPKPVWTLPPPPPPPVIRR